MKTGGARAGKLIWWSGRLLLLGMAALLSAALLDISMFESLSLRSVAWKTGVGDLFLLSRLLSNPGPPTLSSIPLSDESCTVFPESLSSPVLATVTTRVSGQAMETSSSGTALSSSLADMTWTALPGVEESLAAPREETPPCLGLTMARGF